MAEIATNDETSLFFFNSFQPRLALSLVLWCRRFASREISWPLFVDEVINSSSPARMVPPPLEGVNVIPCLLWRGQISLVRASTNFHLLWSWQNNSSFQWPARQHWLEETFSNIEDYQVLQLVSPPPSLLIIRVEGNLRATQQIKCCRSLAIITISFYNRVST